MLRLRVRYHGLPRSALVLADTPKPGCRDCGGYGEVIVGGYEEPDYGPCHCHTDRYWTVLHLPLAVVRLARRLRYGRRPAADPWAADDHPF